MAKIKQVISQYPVQLFLVPLLLLFLFTSCDKSTDPKETKGSITGKVMSSQTAIHPAFIFCGDSLWATTDDSGSYSIASVDEGSISLLCSAVNYRDTTSQVQVSGGQTATLDFYLTPDTSTGWIRGEFQDIILFDSLLITHPSMANWDAQQIWQSITGATMISMYLQYDVPRPKIYLDDTQISITDEWAQYAFKLQSGTYRITGKCDGYYDASETVTVLPGKLADAVYVTFFMMRTSAPKLVMKY